jgi:iron(III) transport system permease protein
MRRGLRSFLPYAVLLPVLWIIVSFIVFPTIATLIQSFDGGMKHYRDFFFSSKKINPNLQALGNSLYVSTLSVLLCGILGTLLAFLVNRFDFPGRRAMNAIALAPLILPALVGVIAFIFLYGESGFITKGIQFLWGLEKVPFTIKGVKGIIFVHVYTQYVYFFMNVSSALKGLDNSLEEAGRSLGASKIMVFFKVTLPMLTPALVASSLLVFMTSMASFSAPLLLGGNFRMLSTQLYISKLNGDMSLAAVQAIILSSISIIFLVGLKWFEGRKSFIAIGKGVATRNIEVKNPAAKAAFIFCAGIIEFILLLPPLVVLVISFVPEGTWTYQIYPTVFNLENYKKLFSNPRVFQPIANSLKMAGIATALDALFGVVAAYLLIKTKVRGKLLLDSLVMLPWALPGSVIAINLILAFNKPTLFSFNTIWVGTFWILPLAYFVRHLPLVVRNTSAALSQLDDSLEEAARNLGASWISAFRMVVLPIIMPGVMSGILLAFVSACGEFTSSFMLYIFSNKPISVEMAAQMDQFNLGQACAYGVLQIILIFIVTLLTNHIVKTEKITLGGVA